MNTKDRVRALAATGEYETMEAVADVVGVTRERVRQIIRSENIPWNDYFVRLEWECPGCGEAISISRSKWLNDWRVKPAHCRACSALHRSRFCKRGHLRTDHEGKRGMQVCLACTNTLQACVVERRSCVDCGCELEMTVGMMRRIEGGYATGQRCRSCQGRRIGIARKGKRNR